MDKRVGLRYLLKSMRLLRGLSYLEDTGDHTATSAIPTSILNLLEGDRKETLEGDLKDAETCFSTSL